MSAVMRERQRFSSRERYVVSNAANGLIDDLAFTT
jgi:hypothetical protein